MKKLPSNSRSRLLYTCRRIVLPGVSDGRKEKSIEWEREEDILRISLCLIYMVYETESSLAEHTLP